MVQSRELCCVSAAMVLNHELTHYVPQTVRNLVLSLQEKGSGSGKNCPFCGVLSTQHRDEALAPQAS